MHRPMYRLGIEEIAYATGVLGGNEAAALYLRSHLEDRPPLELNGRLLAASHALVARGLLDFDMESGAKRLEPEFAVLIETLARARCSLRVSRRSRTAQAIMGMTFGDGAVVDHRIERAVVGTLELLPAQEAAVERIRTFLGLNATGSPDTQPNHPAATFPAELLSGLERTDPVPSGKRVETLMAAAGLSPAMARDFAEDVAGWTLRGSLLQLAPVASQAALQIETKRGALVLCGSSRQWLVELAAPEANLARLYPYHPETLSALVGRLTA